MSKHHIIIAGGGIGGLTTALALARTGHRVTVLEQSPVLAEVGAGIQLSPNASRVLVDLGLHDSLARSAVTPREIVVHSSRNGGIVARTPVGRAVEARYGAPFWVIHRADLLSALAGAVAAEPAIELVLDARFRDASPAPDAITVHATIAGQPGDLEGDGLIGADGVRSRVRTKLRAGPPARYTGRTAYRATVPIERVPDEYRDVTGMWLSPRAHLVHYPLRAGREFNLVAVVEDDWQNEGWSIPASKAEFATHFGLTGRSRWPEAARRLLDLPETWTKWALCGFDSDFEWSSGAVTLLGDAAHATLPFAAQGGGMAIEDAAVVARALEGAPTVSAGFRAYETLRKQRTRAIVEQAVSNGRLYHLPHALALFRDAALKMGVGGQLLDRMDWIYRWHPERPD
ncbi:MAG: FAD-dependent oxidoreductase [Siculibacillus sp.]|nr:FAD-dependent oxidoreductase [Siculibacillus sp.]